MTREERIARRVAEIEERLSSRTFDPTKHPRGRGGKWRKIRVFSDGGWNPNLEIAYDKNDKPVAHGLDIEGMTEFKSEGAAQMHAKAMAALRAGQVTMEEQPPPYEPDLAKKPRASDGPGELVGFGATKEEAATVAAALGGDRSKGQAAETTIDRVMVKCVEDLNTGRPLTPERKTALEKTLAAARRLHARLFAAYPELREAKIEEALFNRLLHPRDPRGRWTPKHLATLNAISRNPFHGELATEPEAQKRISELRAEGLVRATFVPVASPRNVPGSYQGGLVLTAAGNNLLRDTIGHGPRATGDTSYVETSYERVGPTKLPLVVRKPGLKRKPTF